MYLESNLQIEEFCLKKRIANSNRSSEVAFIIFNLSLVIFSLLLQYSYNSITL